MKIGFVQYAPFTGDKQRNLSIIRDLLEGEEADLFVLPEMGTTGYPTSTKEELLEASESVDGPLVQSLIEIAKEKNTCLIVGMPEVIDGKVYNTSVAVSPEGLLSKHQKSHLFMEEIGCFEKGTNKPTVFEWRGARIGMGVCYDYMFPEFWSSMGLAGADLFCNTANFVFDYGFRVMQVRSIENGVFSITVNRVGSEGEIVYKGGSEIVDNHGNILVKANNFEENVYIVDVDLTLSRNKRWNKFNDLHADRRDDLY